MVNFIVRREYVQLNKYYRAITEPEYFSLIVEQSTSPNKEQFIQLMDIALGFFNSDENFKENETFNEVLGNVVDEPLVLEQQLDYFTQAVEQDVIQHKGDWLQKEVVEHLEYQTVFPVTCAVAIVKYSIDGLLSDDIENVKLLKAIKYNAQLSNLNTIFISLLYAEDRVVNRNDGLTKSKNNRMEPTPLKLIYQALAKKVFAEHPCFTINAIAEILHQEVGGLLTDNIPKHHINKEVLDTLGIKLSTMKEQEHLSIKNCSTSSVRNYISGIYTSSKTTSMTVESRKLILNLIEKSLQSEKNN